MNVSLRELAVSDFSYFNKWWKDSDLLKMTSGANPATEEESKKYFHEILHDTSRLDRMIIIGNEIIGHIALVKNDEAQWELFIVIGSKEAHGKGYGTTAIRQMLDIARTKGIRSLFLEVRPDNIVAKHVYQICGFHYKKKVQHQDLQLSVTERWEIDL